MGEGDRMRLSGVAAIVFDVFGLGRETLHIENRIQG